MKKYYYSLFAAAAMLLATSCSQEEEMVQADNGVAKFSVSLQGATGSRAAGDGQTVDKLYYEVYEDDTKIPGDAYDNVVDMTAGKADVNIPLMRGHEYQIVFWAQNSEAGIYDAEDLKAISVNYGNATANNEAYDAFYNAITYTVEAGVTTVELTRPFAQLNVGTTTTDWTTAKNLLQGNDPADQSTVTVDGLATTFNASSGEATGTADVTFAAADFIGEEFTLNDVTYKNLAMNYLLVPGTKEEAKTTTTVNLTFKNNDVDVHSFEVLYVPVERNYRTNIVGNLFTQEGDFEVVVKPGFNEPAILYPELLLAAANGGTVTLDEDVTLEGPLAVNADMVLNIAEGKTLIGSINVAEGVSLTVTGGAINNTDENTSGIVSNGDLTLNDVEITSARHALRIESGNVVINGGIYKSEPTSKKTLHALNVGDGTTSIANVTIKGGTFIGPKGTIADSGAAVNVQAGSTVTIEGGDFSGGKNNTLSSKGTLTVVGGTFDQDPAAYVDSSSKNIKIGAKWYVVTNELTVIAGTAEEFAAALQTDLKNINVVLAADIEVSITSLGQQTGGSGEYKLGSENTESITIDLNDKKLNITTTYWSAIGAKNDNATFTIKNGSMTSTGNSAGTWNAWDLRFSNCNYVFEDVTFEKAVALDNVGKSTSMKEVTITDTHNTDTYGLWITAEGQTVTLEDCVIDMTPATDGRGIKIDEQYVDAPVKVTLNVSGTTFKTDEKSAVLVKSAAGAEINWGEGNDITEVIDDDFNAVWVDEDAAAYADLVVVNGTHKILEGTTYTVVSTVEDLNAAISEIEAGGIIYLNDGTYEGIFEIGNNVTITSASANKATIKGRVNIKGNNITSVKFINVKFDNNDDSKKKWTSGGSLMVNYPSIIMAEANNGVISFEYCEFQLNTGAFAYTNTSSSMSKFNHCKFNGTFNYAIYARANIEVSNCTYSTTVTNVLTGANLSSFNNGKVIFVNNTLENGTSIALTSAILFLSTHNNNGVWNGPVTFTVYENLGFTYNYQKAGSFTVISENHTFTEGSESFDSL